MSDQEASARRLAGLGLATVVAKPGNVEDIAAAIVAALAARRRVPSSTWTAWPPHAPSSRSSAREKCPPQRARSGGRPVGARRVPSAAVVFAFGALAIRAESDDTSHLEWLQEFLAPQFEVSASRTFDCRVILTENDKRHGAMHALGAGAGTFDAFSHDTRVVSLSRWLRTV